MLVFCSTVLYPIVWNTHIQAGCLILLIPAQTLLPRGFQPPPLRQRMQILDRFYLSLFYFHFNLALEFKFVFTLLNHVIL